MADIIHPNMCIVFAKVQHVYEGGNIATEM